MTPQPILAKSKWSRIEDKTLKWTKIFYMYFKLDE